MLREPTPDFMLKTIQQLRQDGHPKTKLEENVCWLVTGDGRPVGCPDGFREQRFLEQLEVMRESCVERLSALIPDNQEHSILDVLEARLDGIDQENRICEIAFNNSLSLLFEQHEEDHALIRWLLEGEFLETEYNGEIDDEPNRTLVYGLDENLVLSGLPLHISSTWDPHGRNGPGTMGPTARLLCYWVRGEYLGSSSVTELDFVTSDQYSDFELRHKATALQLVNGTVRSRRLRRRVRMHALSKIEVFTLVHQGDISERWVLRDSSANRYQHGLSESLKPGENFLECAIRGLGEELGIESSTIDLEPTPYGPTRVEWGRGRERFDSRSMSGLPSIMCINPFYFKFDSDPDPKKYDSDSDPSDYDFVKLKDGIPTRQFVIDDAGGTTLNWLPDSSNLNLEETLALIGDDQDIQTNQWYALNYPDLPSTKEEKKVHEIITAMIGTTLLYHLPTKNQSNRPDLIGSEDKGLLYTKMLWSRGATKEKLGVTSFENTNGQVYALVNELITNKIVNARGKQHYKPYMSSIGRLLQPVIEGQLAVQWLFEKISNMRRDSNLTEVNNEGILSLLPWKVDLKVSRNKNTDNLESNEIRLSRWQTALNELFDILNNPGVWHFDGTLSSLLQSQPQFEGPRTIILFKRLDDGSFDVKLQEKVNLPVAQLHSDLLNHLRRREEEQSSLDTLDEVTFGSIRDTVNELRELHAMVVRLD